MAFQFKAPPQTVVDQFSQDLAGANFLGGQFNPTPEKHLPAYLLRLTDLVKIGAGSGIDAAAQQVAWQCLGVAANDPTTVAVGDVVPAGSTPQPDAFAGTLQTASISHGDVVNAAYQRAVDLSNALAQQAECSGYEPRVLRIPGLLLTMFWLKAPSGGTDWIVPLHPPTPQIPELATKSTYNVREFLKIAKPLAQKRLKFNTPN